MKGYDNTTYGEAFADVYDDWYDGVSDVEATVATIIELAGPAATRVLELAVGTGRLAVPLAQAFSGAERSVEVIGIDASPAMLKRLEARDHSQRVTAVQGDMVDDLPAGPFDVVFIAYNSLFNLVSDAAQQRCFAEVAARLTPDGRFVVEAFVPDNAGTRDAVTVRSMTTDQVVLSVSRHDDQHQLAEGHYIEITEGGGVRLRPWAVRYATVAQLDAMASAAGLVLEHRWEGFDRAPFTDESTRHVSAYRRRNP